MKIISPFFLRIFPIFLFFLPILIRAEEGSFQSPVPQISVPKCKFSLWSQLQSECKMPLPLLTPDLYESESKNMMLRRIYTVLYGATYDYGWDATSGSHLGVDIATSQGTPVVAIGAGIIEYAGWMNGWGNVVVMRHVLTDGTNIWSNYAHLESILVKKGESIPGGTQIATVGSTGNSTGAHLHFQVDIGGSFHPYYYSKCANGKNPMAIVNGTLCRSDFLVNTIDPLALLQSGKKALLQKSSVELIQKRPVQALQQSQLLSRKAILESEMKEFLQDVEISLHVNAPGNNIKVGTKVFGEISIFQKNGKPFPGNIPSLGLTLRLQGLQGTVFPVNIIALDSGKRSFEFVPNGKGAGEIQLLALDQVLAKVEVFGYIPGDFAQPQSLRFQIPRSCTLGQICPISGIFYSKFGSKLLGMPYKGKYVIRVTQGKVKFCNDVSGGVGKCPPDAFVEMHHFEYNDTQKGIVRLQAVALDSQPFEMQIEQIEGPLHSKFSRKPIVLLPKDLLRNHRYYDSMLDALRKGFIWAEREYIAPDFILTQLDLKNIVERIWQRRIWQAQNQPRKIQLLREKQKFLDTFPKDAIAPVTRIIALRALLQSFQIPASTESLLNNTIFTDAPGGQYPEISFLSQKYDFQWMDSFGVNYFQPEKNITRAEVMYLLDTLQR